MAAQAPGATPYIFKASMDTYASLEGQKRESPAAERNKGYILEVLREYLGSEAATAAAVAAAAASGRRRPVILEVASGSGQHCAHLAAGLPAYDVQPTDLTPELFDSIAAYAATTPPAAAAAAAAGAAAGQSGGGGGLPNVLLPPLVLDASSLDWPAVAAAGVSAGSGSSSSGGSSSGRLDAAAVLVINMCHISPLPATRGLLKGAGTALRPGGGLLFVYGPFTVQRGRHTTDSNAAFHASLQARDPSWGYRDVEDMKEWAAEAGLETLEVREMPANNFMLVFRRT
ncbi:hypothetical protein CHLRE_07g327687v5 [Chlamydomonas reinhardtii]|uniref:Uncharacterized protein n=1 Tax=Chlamydomonas reinhardtii TaxID=3055 RepID=A0A2K3DJM6_CHLRE|nr:uncharacterized protein CHLRE_07g327687v5 [Chlamydomonas reinhardtii]PNW80736.1 hypothetical protein CHLRE_07g327687v5 [Chlamydomonas reinhardtii]